MRAAQHIAWKAMVCGNVNQKACMATVNSSIGTHHQKRREGSVQMMVSGMASHSSMPGRPSARMVSSSSLWAWKAWPSIIDQLGK